MTESSPDRLDRIEATLERVSQQLDNQVVVNAELRQSTTELRQSTSELRETSAHLTENVNILMNSVTSLVSVVNQHQYRMEFLVEEVGEIRGDMREMRSEIVGLQTENRRILEILERRE
jgi:methyl-accepting chemotaxis protein